MQIKDVIFVKCKGRSKKRFIQKTSRAIVYVINDKILMLGFLTLKHNKRYRLVYRLKFMCITRTTVENSQKWHNCNIQMKRKAK